MTGRVLTIATLKGGSGKSTIAACLAVHWLRSGLRSALVDADPQQSILRMSRGPYALGGVPVQADDSEDVARRISRLAREYDRVVVDTAGFRNRTTIEAIAAADLVIVPVKPSPLDFDVATDTAALIFQINETAERKQRPVQFRFLLNQTTRESVIAKHIRREMQAADFPMLETELVNRVAHGEAALAGATPTLTDANGAAAREISVLANEISALF